MDVGTRIAGLRHAHGMTQEELAGVCLVSRQTISNWETGKTLPDIQSLRQVAATFDTTIDALVADDAPEIVGRASADRREALLLSVLEVAVLASMVPVLALERLMPRHGVIWLAVLPMALVIGMVVRERHLYRRHRLEDLCAVSDYLSGHRAGTTRPPRSGFGRFAARHWLPLALAAGALSYLVANAVLGR